MSDLTDGRWDFTTVQSGEATLSSGNTTANVTHYLGSTPVAGDVMITPTSSLGAASEFYISAYAATTFTITVDADPGTDITFAWRARK